MKNEIRKDWVMRFLIAFMISLQPERKKAPRFSEVLSLSEKRDSLPAIRLSRRGTRNPDLVRVLPDQLCYSRNNCYGADSSSFFIQRIRPAPDL